MARLAAIWQRALSSRRRRLAISITAIASSALRQYPPSHQRIQTGVRRISAKPRGTFLRLGCITFQTVETREQSLANEDSDVVRRVVAGEVNDYRVLVERHQDAIYRFVYSLVGHRHEAEDITQDVFLAAYKSLATFDSRRAMFSTWLFTIARNRAINRLNRCRDTTLVKSMPEPIDAHSPGDAVEEDEFLEQLNHALNDLPMDQRTVFVLAEIQELSYAEIADIEHISLGTVKSRLHRAKQHLRSALEGYVRGL